MDTILFLPQVKKKSYLDRITEQYTIQRNKLIITHSLRPSDAYMRQ